MRWRGLEQPRCSDRPIAQPAGVARSTTDSRTTPEPAGCPTLPRSGVAPGSGSLLCGDAISSAESPCAQGESGNYVEGISIINSMSTGRCTLSPDRVASSTDRPHVDPQAVG